MKRANAGVPSGEAGVLMRRAGEGGGRGRGGQALSGYGSSSRAQSCVAGAELMCDAAQIHPDIETLHGKPHLCQPPPPPPTPTPDSLHFLACGWSAPRLATRFLLPALSGSMWAQGRKGNERQKTTASTSLHPRMQQSQPKSVTGKLVCNRVSTWENLTSRSELQLLLFFLV